MEMVLSAVPFMVQIAKYLETDNTNLVGCSDEEEIRETFEEMDKDGDGLVTAAEIRHFDEDLTAEEVNSSKQSKNFGNRKKC